MGGPAICRLLRPQQLFLPLVRLLRGGPGGWRSCSLFSVCHRGPCPPSPPPTPLLGALLPVAAPRPVQPACSRDCACAQVRTLRCSHSNRSATLGAHMAAAAVSLSHGQRMKGQRSQFVSWDLSLRRFPFNQPFTPLPQRAGHCHGVRPERELQEGRLCEFPLSFLSLRGGAPARAAV